MASGKRKEGESFEGYRQRLANEHRTLKVYLSGRVVHASSVYGTKVNKPK